MSSASIVHDETQLGADAPNPAPVAKAPRLLPGSVILGRALAADPQARHASLDALLGELAS